MSYRDAWGEDAGEDYEEEEEEMAKHLEALEDNVMVLIDCRSPMLAKDDQGKVVACLFRVFFSSFCFYHYYGLSLHGRSRW